MNGVSHHPTNGARTGRPSERSALCSDDLPDSSLHCETVTPDKFKAAFRNHAAGVAVITADAGHGPVTLTATSVFSVSVEPPLLVFAISHLSSSSPTVSEAETVVVHLLTADQVNLAKLGATSGIDRFADTSLWSRLPTGETYFPSAHTWILARSIDRLNAGGSTVIVAQAVQAKVPTAGELAAGVAASNPLIYHNRAWHTLGERTEIDT